jgi:hypothetical protein
MPEHHSLIESHLDALRALPAETVDELADGLYEGYDRHRARGRTPDDAARAAIVEFGTVEQVLGAFTQITPYRRAARLLLASGPLAGLCWGTGLLSAHAWTWPIPAWAAAATGTALAAIGALLLIAVRTLHVRRTALPAMGGLVLLDTLAIAGVLAVAPVVSWPLRLAIAFSVVRAALTARALRARPAGG